MGSLYSRRIVLLFYLLLSAGMLLVGRLFVIQVGNEKQLAIAALEQRVQEIPLEMARGEVLDRNGIPLTDNTVYYSVAVFPQQLTDRKQEAAETAVFLHLPETEVLEKLEQHSHPFKLKTGIDAATAQLINHLRLPGILAVDEKVRYGYGNLAAHTVGYINAADNTGMSGVEEAYDRELKGNCPTYVAAFVDGAQHIIPGLGYKRLHPTQDVPSNVVLTLDAEIQRTVEAIINRKVAKGAVVVMDPATGEILALASRPNFDAGQLDAYLKDHDAPLLNRGITAFSPGSVFKLVVASAALEMHVTAPEEVFYDPGYIDVGKLRFHGWDFKQGGHGRITFKEALAYSSNPVFITVGMRVGPKALVEYAQRFGLGRTTQLGLTEEESGHLPDAEKLFPGDMANFSIGQGSLEVTPMQMAAVVAAIVNNGVQVTPHLVKRVERPDRSLVRTAAVGTHRQVISPATAGMLRDMMEGVITYGTGQKADIEQWGAGGKTGSAETGSIDKNGRSLNHAWFAGYTPRENPRYVVVVMVEEGMSGGDVAAPLFREIMTEVLKRNP